MLTIQPRLVQDGGQGRGVRLPAIGFADTTNCVRAFAVDLGKFSFNSFARRNGGLSR